MLKGRLGIVAVLASAEGAHPCPAMRTALPTPRTFVATANTECLYDVCSVRQPTNLNFSSSGRSVFELLRDARLQVKC